MLNTKNLRERNFNLHFLARGFTDVGETLRRDAILESIPTKRGQSILTD